MSDQGAGRDADDNAGGVKACLQAPQSGTSVRHSTSIYVDLVLLGLLHTSTLTHADSRR